MARSRQLLAELLHVLLTKNMEWTPFNEVVILCISRFKYLGAMVTIKIAFIKKLEAELQFYPIFLCGCETSEMNVWS